MASGGHTHVGNISRQSFSTLKRSQLVKLQRAADLNNADAQYALAGIYERSGSELGIGPADAAQAAVDLYSKSARTGHMGSILRLKRLQGLPKNMSHTDASQSDAVGALEAAGDSQIGSATQASSHSGAGLMPLHADVYTEAGQETPQVPPNLSQTINTKQTVAPPKAVPADSSSGAGSADAHPALSTPDVADALGDLSPPPTPPQRDTRSAVGTLSSSSFSRVPPTPSAAAPPMQSKPPPAGLLHDPPHPGPDLLSNTAAHSVWQRLQRALRAASPAGTQQSAALDTQASEWSSCLSLAAARAPKASQACAGGVDMTSNATERQRTSPLCAIVEEFKTALPGGTAGGGLDCICPPLEATALLAWVYLGGVRALYNPYRGLQLAVAACVAGSPSGQALVAWARRGGHGCTQDEARAAAAAKQAADAGHAGAAYELSNMFRQGSGVPVCSDSARTLLVVAARRRHPLAAATVAHLRLRGLDDVPYSHSSSLLWWRVASAAGNTESSRRLALALQREHGSEHAEVTRLLKQAAVAGDVESGHFLGSFLAPRNAAAGLACQLAAAEHGSAPAAKAVAAVLHQAAQRCTGTGDQGVQLAQAAEAWLRRAAQMGDLAAMHQLGLQLGSKPEHAEEAFQLQLAAAERGHASAATAVSQAFHMGKGVSPDRASARKWLQTAARLGCHVARKRLAAGAKRHRRQ